jgi:multidrug efflux system membrane fusion protein
MRFVYCALLAAAALLSSCSQKASDTGGGKGAKAGGGPPVPVFTARATNQEIPVEIKAVGRVQAYSMVSMRAQVTGSIFKVHFREGQEVKAGDLLFTLDQRPFEAALTQAEANLKRDEAQMVNARLNFERTSNLFASKIASQSDYDTAAAAFESAKGTVMAGAAAITNAQVNLSYTSIRAPIDGRTGNLNVKEGNVVKAPDDVLMTLTQIHPIYVAFAVPEQNLSAIRRRADEATLPVSAFPSGDTNNGDWGELTFIDNIVDTNTGTILLKGTFANTNTVLWPGQFVQTTLTLSNLTQATVVPSQAVQTGQNGDFVFVVKDDQTVEARPVGTSITYDGVRVITSGLKSGEIVVTDGQMKLTPNAKVSVKSSEGTGTSTNTAAATP